MRGLLIAGASFLFCAAVCAGGCLVFGDVLGTGPPLFTRRGAYSEIVEAIRRGDIAPEPGTNIVTLPAAHASLAPRGEVWCREADRRDELAVFFPTWHARGLDVQGYLYSESPPGEDLAATWSQPGGPGAPATVFGLGGFNLEHIDGPWYWVIRRMD